MKDWFLIGRDRQYRFNVSPFNFSTQFGLAGIKSLCHFEGQSYDFGASAVWLGHFLDINWAVTLVDSTIGVTVMLWFLSGERDALRSGGTDMMVLLGYLLFCLKRIEWFYPWQTRRVGKKGRNVQQFGWNTGLSRRKGKVGNQQLFKHLAHTVSCLRFGIFNRVL